MNLMTNQELAAAIQQTIAAIDAVSDDHPAKARLVSHLGYLLDEQLMRARRSK